MCVLSSTENISSNIAQYAKINTKKSPKISCCSKKSWRPSQSYTGLFINNLLQLGYLEKKMIRTKPTIRESQKKAYSIEKMHFRIDVLPFVEFFENHVFFNKIPQEHRNKYINMLRTEFDKK